MTYRKQKIPHKKIDGKSYYLYNRFEKKSDAESSANSVRRIGHLARVLPSGKKAYLKWTVWARETR